MKGDEVVEAGEELADGLLFLLMGNNKTILEHGIHIERLVPSGATRRCKPKMVSEAFVKNDEPEEVRRHILMERKLGKTVRYQRYSIILSGDRDCMFPSEYNVDHKIVGYNLAQLFFLDLSSRINSGQKSAFCMATDTHAHISILGRWNQLLKLVNNLP